MSKRRRRSVKHQVNWADVRDYQEQQLPVGVIEDPWIPDVPLREFIPGDEWQERWAPTTLDVVQTVWRTAGAKYYYNDPIRRDDLHDWLLVEAQKVAVKYRPQWHVRDPERYWGAYLYSTLLYSSKYHFASTNGTNNSANRDVGKQMNSFETWLARFGEKGEQVLHAIARPVLTYQPVDPLAYVLLMETVAEADGTAPAQKGRRYCIEEGCWEDRVARRELCPTHINERLKLWGTSATLVAPSRPRQVCVEPECTEFALARKLCNKHYLRAKQAGTLDQYGRVNKGGTCMEEGCGESSPAGGRCKPHRMRHYSASKPTCRVDGCTNKSKARGLCGRHGDQWRRGELQVEGLPDRSVDQ